MAQSANTPESRTLLTPTIRAVPAKGGSAGPFSGSCCHQHIAVCPLCRAAAPRDNGMLHLLGCPPRFLQSPGSQDSERKSFTLDQRGNQQQGAHGAGDQPHLQHSHSCAAQPPWGRGLSHKELKPSQNSDGAGPAGASKGKPLPGHAQQSSSPSCSSIPEIATQT